MGKLATPNLLVAAAAPAIGAVALEKFGEQTMLLLLTIASLIPVVCALILTKLNRNSPRLRTHSQNMTIAARAQADRKISACLSKRMATLRQSFRRPNMFSIL